MEQPEETSVEIDSLWKDFHNNVDDESRNSLIIKYMPHAELIAKHIFSRRIYDDIEYTEYVQLAMAGLIESIDRYRPDSLASFTTFAAKRIRGAIHNGLTKLTEKREQNAYLYRRTKDRIASLEQNVDGNDLFSKITELTSNIAIGCLLDDSGIYQDPENDILPDNLYASVVLESIKSDIRAVVLTLPEQEKKIIEYHYFQQISFHDIGEILDLTKGRISQLHRSAMTKISQSFTDADSINEVF